MPIARRHTFTETREFSEIIAGAIARAHPGLATTQWVKAKRRGVLIDTNQNGEGKTIASAYSVRPKAGAPVSTPLRWEEVNESLDPAAFTMEAVLERVAQEGDLFEGVLSSKQSLGLPRCGLAPLGGGARLQLLRPACRRRSALTPTTTSPPAEPPPSAALRDQLLKDVPRERRLDCPGARAWVQRERLPRSHRR